MHKLKNSVRLSLIYAAVVLLAGGQPMVAMAEATDTSPPTASTTTDATPTPALTTPAPAEQERSYTYNPDTKHWDSDKWAYNPATGQYEAVVVPLVEQQQPVVLPPATDSPSTSATITSNTDAVIDNTLNSDATTGNATVGSNTTGGNATTGDATAIATLMNTINSSVGGDGAQFATFVTDVVGDVHGDIMLYPMLLAAMLQAANTPTDSTITANNSAAITNDLNLNATSGDASVVKNTNAGNATTGTANTVANVMNIINSIIAANQSFVGTVNIYGNLDGDILVAPDFLPQLLASNTSGSSAPANSLVVSANDTQSIINNIDLNAASGNALVSNNTNAGSATTGDAKTNLVLLNLSGHQIVAKDSMLVFVNVLGQWVGLIVDAPAGTSAAALGTDVTTNNVAPDLTIKVDNDSQIVNNIKLNSQSGDATVASNTNAGSAKTGDATASANVANISGSQLGLTGWFGVLFINVFGSWFGSFGVDTAAGKPIVPGRGGLNEPPATTAPTAVPFQFVPHTEPSSQTTSARRVASLQPQAPVAADTVVEDQPTVASDTEDKDVSLSAYVPTSSTPTAPAQQTQSASTFDFLPFIGSALMIGMGAIATRMVIAVIRGRGIVA
jgi:hypothetical protein